MDGGVNESSLTFLSYCLACEKHTRHQVKTDGNVNFKICLECLQRALQREASD